MKLSNKETISLASTSLPQYLTVPDRVFKKMLSSAVEGGDTIAQWLDTDEKLKSTRELVHLVNLSRYLQLQQRMWQAYFELGNREGVWAPRKSKSTATQQNTCSTYGRSEAFVKQRQKTIERQMIRTTNELQQFGCQLPEWTDKAQPPISSTVLFEAVDALVRNGQRRLTAEYEHKHLMLKLDADDHRLISAVYALNPTTDQVCSKINLVEVRRMY